MINIEYIFIHSLSNFSVKIFSIHQHLGKNNMIHIIFHKEIHCFNKKYFHPNNKNFVTHFNL